VPRPEIVSFILVLTLFSDPSRSFAVIMRSYSVILLASSVIAVPVPGNDVSESKLAKIPFQTTPGLQLLTLHLLVIKREPQRGLGGFNLLSGLASTVGTVLGGLSSAATTPATAAAPSFGFGSFGAPAAAPAPPSAFGSFGQSDPNAFGGQNSFGAPPPPAPAAAAAAPGSGIFDQLSNGLKSGWDSLTGLLSGNGLEKDDGKDDDDAPKPPAPQPQYGPPPPQYQAPPPQQQQQQPTWQNDDQSQPQYQQGPAQGQAPYNQGPPAPQQNAKPASPPWYQKGPGQSGY